MPRSYTNLIWPSNDDKIDEVLRAHRCRKKKFKKKAYTYTVRVKERKRVREVEP